MGNTTISVFLCVNLSFNITSHLLRRYRWWDRPGAAWHGLPATHPQTLCPRRQPMVPAGAEWMGGAVLPDSSTTGRVYSVCRAPKSSSRQYRANTGRASSPVRTTHRRAGPGSCFRATARAWNREGSRAWSQREAWRSVVVPRGRGKSFISFYPVYGHKKHNDYKNRP